MEVERYEHGVPSWVDLGTPDIPKAIEFYSGLFGWQIEPGPPETGGYSIAMMRGRPVAGVGPQMNPGPPYWTTYVSVNSTDEAVEKAKAAGGKVFMEPMDVMDAGRMAVIADPIGAVISVWQPNQMPGAGVVNEPNSYSWSELVTTDVEASKQFYSAVFGWGTQTHGEGGTMAARALEANGLVKQYKRTTAVAGVSLAVAASERVALLGANGAGKTTTLLMLLGAITPDEGSVTVLGHELPGGRSRAMEDVG